MILIAVFVYLHISPNRRSHVDKDNTKALISERLQNLGVNQSKSSIKIDHSSLSVT